MSAAGHNNKLKGLTRIDDRPIKPARDEILAFSCVRNEILRLPHFLDHYRLLGVRRFLFVDNASDDGTTEYLLGQPDAHVFHTADSYARSRCGVDWLNELLNRFGCGHWVVVVDADELLIYPRCEHLDLVDLTLCLEQRQCQALLTFLLDMYAAGPIAKAAYDPGTPFTQTCPYFDTDGYQFDKSRPGLSVPARGGARHRMFWKGRSHRGNSPFLPKIPLVRWSEKLRYEASTHTLAGVNLANVTGALLHFKFFADFVEAVVREQRRKEHWDAAAQYSAYCQVMADQPDLDPMYPGSARFENSEQLVQLGLLQEPAPIG